MTSLPLAPCLGLLVNHLHMSLHGAVVAEGNLLANLSGSCWVRKAVVVDLLTVILMEEMVMTEVMTKMTILLMTRDGSDELSVTSGRVEAPKKRTSSSSARSRAPHSFVPGNSLCETRLQLRPAKDSWPSLG